MLAWSPLSSADTEIRGWFVLGSVHQADSFTTQTYVWNVSIFAGVNDLLEKACIEKAPSLAITDTTRTTGWVSQIQSRYAHPIALPLYCEWTADEWSGCCLISSSIYESLLVSLLHCGPHLSCLESQRWDPCYWCGWLGQHQVHMAGEFYAVCFESDFPSLLVAQTSLLLRRSSFNSTSGAVSSTGSCPIRRPVAIRSSETRKTGWLDQARYQVTSGDPHTTFI